MKELTTLQKLEKENPELVNKKYIDLLKEENSSLESENSELKSKVQELEEQIEKMKNCDNCKHNWKEYGGDNSCELTWTKKLRCTRKLNFSNNFEDLWELG